MNYFGVFRQILDTKRIADFIETIHAKYIEDITRCRVDVNIVFNTRKYSHL